MPLRPNQPLRKMAVFNGRRVFFSFLLCHNHDPLHREGLWGIQWTILDADDANRSFRMEYLPRSSSLT